MNPGLKGGTWDVDGGWREDITSRFEGESPKTGSKQFGERPMQEKASFVKGFVV
jgi:hypothetical protein